MFIAQKSKLVNSNFAIFQNPMGSFIKCEQARVYARGLQRVKKLLTRWTDCREGGRIRVLHDGAIHGDAVDDAKRRRATAPM